MPNPPGSENPVNYEPFDHMLVVCMTCGAIVAINHMTTHTHWHEGRWQEPVVPKTQR